MILAHGVPGLGSAGRAGGGPAGSRQGLIDEGAGKLFDVAAGGVGDVAQGSLPGKDRQPADGAPDGVFVGVAAPPLQHAGVGQLVERGAQMTQGVSSCSAG